MVYSVFLWRKGFRQDNRLNYSFLLGGFAFHTVAMFKRGFSFDRCPVGNLYEAITFLLWTIVACYLLIGAWSRLRFLGAFASPIVFGIGIFALFPELDNPHGATPEFRTSWASVHASLILLSYGAFGLSSIAGIMYLSQEHDLKFHKLRAMFSLMPPIERLEKIINGLLFAGFVLLTAGLSVSPLLLKQKYNVFFKYDPKLIWSIFVWAVYLALLIMRWRFAQGGRRFAWGAIGTFAFVLLTFWGVNLFSPAHN